MGSQLIASKTMRALSRFRHDGSRIPGWEHRRARAASARLAGPAGVGHEAGEVTTLADAPTGLLSRPKEENRRLTSRDEDPDLVSAARKGDRNAFDRLVERHRDSIIGLAYGYTQDREEALDIAQDAFFKAYRNLGRFRGEAAFSTWLYRIACNLCRDLLRQHARRKVERLEDVVQPNGEIAIESPTRDPRALAEEREMEERVLRAINRLPPKQRDVILLREVADLSYAEIAATVGCRPGTVMSRLFHARQTVARNLEPYTREEEA